MRLLTLVLVRHGETAWNAEARLQGQTDVPLSTHGKLQANLLGERLSKLWARRMQGTGAMPGPPEAVYSSDLQRAVETATLALPDFLKAPLSQMSELRERSFGKFEGLTAAEARAQFPGESHHNHGESHQEVSDRMWVAMQQIWGDCARTTSEAHGPPVALLVGHGGSLRLLLARLIGLNLEGARHFHLDNTGVSVVEITGETLDKAKGRIFLLNDTAHLERQN